MELFEFITSLSNGTFYLFLVLALRVRVIMGSLQIPWSLLSSFQVYLVVHLIYFQLSTLGVPIILGSFQVPWNLLS
jgi:hypothetical protein